MLVSIFPFTLTFCDPWKGQSDQVKCCWGILFVKALYNSLLFMLSSDLLASMNVCPFPINLLRFLLILLLSEKLLLVLISPNYNTRWKVFNQLFPALVCFIRHMELIFFLLVSFYIHYSRLLKFKPLNVPFGSHFPHQQMSWSVEENKRNGKAAD